MNVRLSVIAGCLSTFALPAFADQVINEPLIVRDRLCAGSTACIDGEIFGDTNIKVNSFEPKIEFADSSVDGLSWALALDDLQSGVRDAISFHDVSTDTYPVVFEQSAPNASLWMAEDGDIGMGTAMPQQELHIYSRFSAALRLEAGTDFGQIWDLISVEDGLSIVDGTNSTVPVMIDTNTPSNTLTTSSNGYVGMGTDSPTAPLEVFSDASFNFIRITAEGVPTNDSVDITYTQGPLTTGELRYNIVDGDGPEMRLNANGDATITGQLITSGPSCGAGCDRVFDEDYDLLSIEDHAAKMHANGYLPAVGPTAPHAAINLTEKLGNMLNELEHAHLYIVQQQDEILSLRNSKSALETRVAMLEANAAQMADMQARLIALEAK